LWKIQGWHGQKENQAQRGFRGHGERDMFKNARELNTKRISWVFERENTMKRICALLIVAAVVLAGVAGCKCPMKGNCCKSADAAKSAQPAEGGCPKSAK
jgi:hypothetical protein